MTEDILPPLAPGEKRKSSGGFLKKLFGKETPPVQLQARNNELEERTAKVLEKQLDEVIPEPPKADISDDTLDKIRSQLGLEQVKEPAKIEKGEDYELPSLESEKSIDWSAEEPPELPEIDKAEQEQKEAQPELSVQEPAQIQPAVELNKEVVDDFFKTDNKSKPIKELAQTEVVEQPEEVVEETEPDKPKRKRAKKKTIPEGAEIDSLREQIRLEEKDKLEDELAQEREKLQKERQALEQEKISFAGNANKVEFKERQIRKDIDDLEKERKKLQTEQELFEEEKAEAEDLATKLPILRQEYDDLQSRIKEAQSKISSVNEAEERLKSREAAILESQRRLQEMEQKIKDEGFAEYLEAELKGKGLVVPQFTSADKIKEKNLELYSMIEECKALIWKNDLENAKKLYNKIRDQYEHSRLDEESRNMLYAIVRELYDDIHLASINQH